MALVKCKECGQMVSDKAEICPKCGCTVQCADSTKVNETSSNPQPSISGKPKLWIGILVLLFILVGGGYYAFTRITNDKVNKTDKGLVVELTSEFIKSVQQYDELAKFSEGYATVQKDGKYGFINIKGEEVISCKYDVAYSFSEGLAVVQRDNKWGVVNSNGEEVIPCKFYDINSFSDGFARVMNADYKCGFINTKGEEVIPCKYGIAESFSEGLAAVWENDRYGFINTNGEVAIPCKYDNALSFSEGLAAIQKNNKWGFINTKGEEAIPCKYDNVLSFSEGLAAIQKNNKWGFININGEEVIPCRYNQVEQFTHGVALATRYSNSELNSYTQFDKAYVDKNGHDTFTEEMKRNTEEQEFEDIEDEDLDDVLEGEELSSTEQNEDLSWIEGNWRYQMQSLGEILETRVGISGDVIVVILNGRNYYTGKFTIEGDHLVYDRHNGMSSYLIIDRANKRLKASEDSYMERF